MSNRCSAPGVGRQDRVRKAEDLVEAPIDEKVSESTREDCDLHSEHQKIRVVCPMSTSNHLCMQYFQFLFSQVENICLANTAAMAWGQKKPEDRAHRRPPCRQAFSSGTLVVAGPVSRCGQRPRSPFWVQNNHHEICECKSLQLLHLSHAYSKHRAL